MKKFQTKVNIGAKGAIGAACEEYVQEPLDGILIVDLLSELVFTNQQFGLMWGISQDILNSKKLGLMIEDVYLRSKIVGKYLEQVKIRSRKRCEMLDEKIVVESGKVINVHSFPMLTTVNEFHGRIWYFRDVTEKVKEEETARLQSAILNDLNEGIALVRISDWTLVSVNTQLERMFGYDQRELENKPFSILYEKDVGRYFEDNFEVILAKLKDKGEASFKTANVKRDGALVRCSVHVSVFNHFDF